MHTAGTPGAISEKPAEKKKLKKEDLDKVTSKNKGFINDPEDGEDIKKI